MNYRQDRRITSKSSKSSLYKIFLIVAVVILVPLIVLFLVTAIRNITIDAPTRLQQIQQHVVFNESVSPSEVEEIEKLIADSELEISGETIVGAVTSLTLDDDMSLVDVYVPVVGFNSAWQSTSNAALSDIDVLVDDSLSRLEVAAIEDLTSLVVGAHDLAVGIPDGDAAFIPIGNINSSLKLLEYEGSYYLDSFNSGGIFRHISFEGSNAQEFSSLMRDEQLSPSDVYKVNMTGVTALTRIMQRKLASVGDPLYFSEHIGEFLADADLTHVSNEVSFKPGCEYSNVLFCSPPEFIETLKASGVDLVELTGNHNNDRGSEFNTQSINMYEELGWGAVGGGLNTTDAAEPFLGSEKGSDIAFLAYNFPDSPNGAAIAGPDRAGANSFDLTRIESDIKLAKSSSDFVIVNVQYWECYAYPDGYVEFPQCDKPIGEQEANFKKIIDLGADMVVGSSAHQPQTYELYDGKPIYYGLGNLYFDQTSWPGTERGIILTHYFSGGVLLQTKLTPTVYDSALQTRVMTDEESSYLLNRLRSAR